MIEHVIVMMMPVSGGDWRLLVISGSQHQKLHGTRGDCESAAVRMLHEAMTRTGAWEGVARG